MSRRMIAVTVGVLFFVQMATAIVGTLLIQAFVDGNPERTPLTLGVLLMVCSGLAVVGIGLLMYQVLKSVNQTVPVLVSRTPNCRVHRLHGLRRLSVDPVAAGSELPAVGIHPDRNRWSGAQLPTVRLPACPSAYRRARSCRIRPFTLGVPLDLFGVLNMNEGPGLSPCSRLTVRVSGPADLADREGISRAVVQQAQFISPAFATTS